MIDALKVIALKSRIGGEAARLLANTRSPMAQTRYNHLAANALSDAQAGFTDAERGLIVAAMEADSVEELKSYDVRVKVTATEKERVQRMANEAGQTVTDFIRQRIGL